MPKFDNSLASEIEAQRQKEQETLLAQQAKRDADRKADEERRMN